jgi:hypothetical protein
MTSSYTANQGIEKMDAGDQSGTWGDTVNLNMDIIDRAISGVVAITLSGTTSNLTTTDGTLTNGMYRVLVLGDSGDLGGNHTLTITPNDQDKCYLVYNNLSANRSAIFTQGSGANATVENGETAWIYADGAGSGAVVRVAISSTKLLDQDGDTGIRVEEGGDDDDTIRFDVAGAEDFTITANTFTALSGSDIAIASGATITNSGTATGFGADAERAYAGVLQTNANFVDQVIFGPSVDGRAWNGLWEKSTVFSSLMLATIEDEGSNTEINIWDLTEQAAGAASTTPLATVDLANAASPTSVAACMGYLIVGSEDGTHIIDPHSGAWAERTVGWPRSLSTSTGPALVDNDVEAVAATISVSAPYDPLTGGYVPTFACTYGTGSAEASIIKDDGVVYDHTGFTVSAAGAKAIGFIGQEIYFGCENSGDTIRLSTVPIAAIQADDWATNNTLKKARASDNFLGCDGGSAFSYDQAVFADSDGLSIYRDPVSTTSAQEGLTAMMNRTYNTGYFLYDTRGTWVANSKTADRSGAGHTMTENGTVTEAVAESGSEIKRYSGFSSSNYLSVASHADWDEVGTGSAMMMCWAKYLANDDGMLCGFGNTGNSIRFHILVTDVGSGVYSFQGIDDGATASTNINAPNVGFSDGTWHHCAWVRVSSTERYLYVDGVQVGSSTTDAGSLSSDGNLPFTIGVQQDGSTNPADNTAVSLVRYSSTPPTSAQVREIYDAEKGMFLANAECLLQSGSTDAVIGVDMDPLTEKVLVTQTDAITIFKKGGLVVDSKPTVNSGNSEKGRLWGDLRSEQNSANAYITAPAVDQRQVNEVVRGLASDLPKGVDLSKAKAWIVLDPSSNTIKASFNVKSVNHISAGRSVILWYMPFKSDDYCITTGTVNTSSPWDATLEVQSHDADGCTLRCLSDAGGGLDLSYNTCVAFGELEND